MARKYDLISELYERTCFAVTDNPANWQSFLKSASRNFRLRFDEQLLVYAQRPSAIVKRKNRYSVVYTYKDDDGTQHQKWETFDTNADAKKRKTQIEFEQQTGTFIVPTATTVADLLEEYCSVYGVNNWAMSTYRSKKGLMYNYITRKERKSATAI